MKVESAARKLESATSAASPGSLGSLSRGKARNDEERFVKERLGMTKRGDEGKNKGVPIFSERR